MSVPLKPWEMSTNVKSAPFVSGKNPYNTERLHSNPIPYPGSGGGSLATMQPSSILNIPSVPPRPAQTRPIYSAYNQSSMMPYGNSPYSNYGSYTSPYGMSNSYYSSPYSTYGPQTNMFGISPFSNNRMYGQYGTPMNGNLGEPSFSQIAEESASSAFQSIESFVSAFGSISAMMESTFHALYSSFRAVIGVADHLGRVKQILSALAIFRFFKWVFRRFLYLVGISKIKPADVESLWNNLSTNDPINPNDLLTPSLRKPSSWPILMFMGFIFAGPYLMWKLIKSLNLDPSQKSNCKWATGESEHFVATAEHPFDPINDRELALKSGQTIRLAPAKFQPAEVKGWVLASDGIKIGLVPTNYIKILGKKVNESNKSHTPLQPNVPFGPEIEATDVASNLDRSYHHKTNSSYMTSDLSNPQIDASGMSSDDDTETLVGEPIGD